MQKFKKKLIVYEVLLLFFIANLPTIGIFVDPQVMLRESSGTFRDSAFGQQCTLHLIRSKHCNILDFDHFLDLRTLDFFVENVDFTQYYNIFQHHIKVCGTLKHFLHLV